MSVGPARLAFTFRQRAGAVLLVLLLVNAGAWGWALEVFRLFPVQLGTASLAYALGLRHAFDADHIAAIDNVTRKLMADGKRPVAVGLFFSLGHSTVVVGLSIAVAVAAGGLYVRFDQLRAGGAVAGTLISSAFLFAIALANIGVLSSLYRTFRRVRDGAALAEAELEIDLARRGLLARLVRPFLRVVDHGWQMYPLGLLFGLGFDTATEVGLLGISATQASRDLPLWSILVFPVLFTCGMTLADTAEGLLMVGVYDWAFIKPIRKLYYNLTITLLSVVVALVVGGLEALGLLADRFALEGPVWDAVRALNDDFGTLGALIVGLFVLGWVLSFAVYRLRGYDRLNA